MREKKIDTFFGTSTTWKNPQVLHRSGSIGLESGLEVKVTNTIPGWGILDLFPKYAFN